MFVWVTGDNFYLTRVQKRNLVNFLSEKFLELAQSKCHEKNCIVVTSGGFEGANKDKAFGSSPEKGILNFCNSKPPDVTTIQFFS
jgi:hypothetical protein